MAAGEMSEAEFTAFLKTVLRQLALHSRDGALHFVCMDWRHLFELLTAGRRVYEELKNLCVWNKTNGGLGSLYRSKHELVAVFKAGARGAHQQRCVGGARALPHQCMGLCRRQRLRDGPRRRRAGPASDGQAGGAGRGRDPRLLEARRHRARCLLWLRHHADRGGAGGPARLRLELDPKYVDAALKRFRGFTGEEPVQAETGREVGRAGIGESP